MLCRQHRARLSHPRVAEGLSEALRRGMWLSPLWWCGVGVTAAVHEPLHDWPPFLFSGRRRTMWPPRPAGSGRTGGLVRLHLSHHRWLKHKQLALQETVPLALCEWSASRDV